MWRKLKKGEVHHVSPFKPFGAWKNFYNSPLLAAAASVMYESNSKYFSALTFGYECLIILFW